MPLVMLKRIFLVLVPLVVILIAISAFLLTETRELTGAIRDVETHSAIPDAVVEMAGNRSTTDEQGRYTMTIPRSKVMLRASADGYESLQMELNGDDLFQRTFAIDFALTPNVVKATLVDAETLKPLPNIPVRVGDKSITTNAQGALNLRGVKQNTPIAVEIPGYQSIAFSYIGHLEFDLPVSPNQVVVSVLDRTTNQPIPSAQLELPEGKFKGDAQGQVVLKRIKPGTIIRASAAGFETAGVSFLGNDLAITLRPNTLDGVVLDATTNQPISGTLVYMGNTIVTTNAKGAYHLDNVPAKTTLTIKSPGYRKTQVPLNGVTRQDIKLAPFLVRGVHIPFGIPFDRVREVMDLAGKTELNAIVISVKAEKGRIEWDSQVPLAKEIGAPMNGTDLSQVIQTCRAKNMYCIARIPVFQDTLLATMRPQYAVKNASGAIFVEGNGTSWVSAFNQEVWTYHIALAKEIAAMGFDEIQWDYVRFPGQSGVSLGMPSTEETRIAAITGFLVRAQKELRPTGVFISADVFGLTAATDDEQYIGQRLRDVGPYVDYVSPMVYPDTWHMASDLITRGLGIKNCTVAVTCPYDIIYNSYKRSAEKTPTKVRLWLQAYSGTGDYGVKEYRLQKKAAVDAGSVGWLFWNGGGVYDPKIFDVP